MADDLRHRYAAAILARLAQTGPTPSDYDLADAVMAVRDEELERLRLIARVNHGLHRSADEEADGWRERAETAEPAIARVRSLAEQLEAEAEQGLKTSVLDSQRAAWSAQVHVTGLFLAALDDTGEA